MCGIAGAVGSLDDRVLRAVAAASESQAHRGPDADGFWQSDPREGAAARPGAAFAHRRLAIIDLSRDGIQPMHDPVTGNTVCFNGEIYNFRSLRAELEAEGSVFTTKTDTEVILKAYARWGDACLTRLRGMFAFALWDARTRRTLLARDRLGIKPLYVADLGGTTRVLQFASEVRALLAGGLVSARIDPRGLETYLWNGFVTGPCTLIQGIRSLGRGCRMWVSDTGEILEEERFWTLPAPGNGDAERLGCVLTEAVELHLTSDVPLGVFLSGGIDSSVLAALATKASRCRIRTFNISFDEAEYDESLHAREVAEQLQTDHVEIRLTQERFARDLHDSLASLDQPTFDGINTYFVSRAVREAGITVALSGAGGDELFGGYRSFVDIPRASRWARSLAAFPEPLLRGLAAGVARAKLGRAGSVPPQTRWGKLGDALSTRGRLMDLYQVSYGLFSSSFIEELRASPASGETDFGLTNERRAELAAALYGVGELQSISLLELACFVGERLLRDTDTTSMANSLEVRVPLLDHEVVEAATAVASDARYQPLGRKQLLRDIGLGGLDRSQFERKKAGFELPLEPWSKASLSGEIESCFGDATRMAAVGVDPTAVGRLWSAYKSGAPGLYWSRIWALFVLADWATRQRASL